MRVKSLGSDPSEPSPAEPPRETVFRSIKERYVENREVDLSAPWTEWLWKRYARFWYGVGCLFLDVVVVGTVIQASTDPTQAWPYAVALLAVVGLSYLEFKGYTRLWPSESQTE